ncbi:hypothetical protein IGI04_015750 [Brassica rapa subsp. trilocularis]|uniref:Uncharacterized protein n=1 Tax=Brassica rapa subsp. trilocularis TaxID=1813537 RepID=A0ABQ7MSH9_BRACM|nr:hypothetical protein IGI04_015750 [Brassica rapa subsp. trilocularis]
MKNISRVSSFLEKFHNTEIRVFAQHWVFPSCFDPVVLASHFPRKLGDEETSVFKNVELLKRYASKNVMLPKMLCFQNVRLINLRHLITMVEQLIRLIVPSRSILRPRHSSNFADRSLPSAVRPPS